QQTKVGQALCQAATALAGLPIALAMPVAIPRQAGRPPSVVWNSLCTNRVRSKTNPIVRWWCCHDAAGKQRIQPPALLAQACLGQETRACANCSQVLSMGGTA